MQRYVVDRIALGLFFSSTRLLVIFLVMDLIIYFVVIELAVVAEGRLHWIPVGQMSRSIKSDRPYRLLNRREGCTDFSAFQ